MSSTEENESASLRSGNPASGPSARQLADDLSRGHYSMGEAIQTIRRQADNVDALVAAIRAISDADEAILDVEEYDLNPTPAKRQRAQKKMTAAWKKARAAIARATKSEVQS